MKKNNLFFTILALLFLTQTIIFGQNNPDNKSSQSPEITISMSRDGTKCGYVIEDSKNVGACPSYSIIITQDGKVIYDGISSVKVRGKHIFKISSEEVNTLISDFEKINFFELKDKYTEEYLPNGGVKSVDHANGTTITFKFGNKTKSVYNFYGAPKELDLLQTKLDNLSKHLQR